MSDFPTAKAAIVHFKNAALEDEDGWFDDQTESDDFYALSTDNHGVTIAFPDGPDSSVVHIFDKVTGEQEVLAGGPARRECLGICLEVIDAQKTRSQVEIRQRFGNLIPGKMN